MSAFDHFNRRHQVAAVVADLNDHDDPHAERTTRGPRRVQSMAPGNAFKLTAEERGSDLWLKLRDYIDAQVQVLREKNDSESNSIADTTLIRGEIRFAKRMLALAGEAGPTSRHAEGEAAPSVQFPAS